MRNCQTLTDTDRSDTCHQRFDQRRRVSRVKSGYACLPARFPHQVELVSKGPTAGQGGEKLQEP
jgi:hypothetical protein